MQELKIGFRFSPNEEELIKILQKKLRGEQLHHDFVFECDIYGDKEPWMIFDKTLKQTYYVFTKLKKKNKSRMERIVGCGTWKEDGTHKIINDENICIGFKKTFHFHVKPSSSSRTKETNGRWIMHEFSIGESNDFVLCEVRNKDLDKVKEVYNPQLWATMKQILADHDVSQSEKSQVLDTRNLGSMENQPQKKIKVSNNIAAQQPMDTSVVLTSSIEEPQEALYMDINFVSVHDIARKQGYDVQSFGTTYLSMEEGNQPQHIIQCGGNVVATEQSNKSYLLDLPIESSSKDLIFDGLTTITNTEDIDIGNYLDYYMPELNYDRQNAFDEDIASLINTEDINIGDYMDSYMPELNSNSQNAFDVMIASLNDQQPPML